MNQRHDVDSVMTAWFQAEAARSSPAGLLEDVLARTSRTRPMSALRASLTVPVMRTQTRLLVGSPSLRLAWLLLLLLMLTALTFGAIAVGSRVLDTSLVIDSGPTTMPQVRWQVQIGDRAPVIRPGPTGAAGDGIVFAPVNVGVDAFLLAIDAISGAERWRISIEGEFGAPSVSDGLVVVASLDGLLRGIDAASGDERWQVAVGSVWMHAVPAVADGLVYMGSFDGLVHAVDAESGEERWSFRTGERHSPTVIVAADGVVYVGGSGRTLYAIDAQSGQELWQRAFAWGRDWGVDGISWPAVAQGVVSVTTGDFLHGVDAATGELLWRFKLSGRELWGPLAGEGVFYADVDAVDPSSGARLWSFTGRVPGHQLRPRAVVQGVVYATGGPVFAVDAETGKELWRFPVDFQRRGPFHDHGGSMGFDWLAMANGVVYVTDQGVLYALDVPELARR